MEIDRYIENGKARRSRIASDICRGKINYNDIQKLVAMPEISSSFIGTTYSNKREQKDWNQDYLELISYAASSEAFNEDYLFFLLDVSEYVNHKKKVKNIAIGAGTGAIIVVLIVLIVLLFCSRAD